MSYCSGIFLAKSVNFIATILFCFLILVLYYKSDQTDKKDYALDKNSFKESWRKDLPKKSLKKNKQQ